MATTYLHPRNSYPVETYIGLDGKPRVRVWIDGAEALFETAGQMNVLIEALTDAKERLIALQEPVAAAEGIHA